MAFIETKDGTKLFYTDWSEGGRRPVVFVASQSVPSTMWNYNLPFFAENGFRVVAFDRRGHGKSDLASGGYDLDTLVEDLHTVLEKLDLRDVLLVGHSLGGAEILRYLARHPGRATGAALFAPVGPLVTRTADDASGVDPAMWQATYDGWRRDFPGWVGKNLRPFFHVDVSPELEHWTSDLISPMSLYVQLRVARTTAGVDLRQDLPRIAVPTLFLHGRHDVSVPLASGRRSASLVPGSRFEEYPDAAHGLPITHADLVNREVLEFAHALAPLPPAAAGIFRGTGVGERF
jgi:pimeloyl-ACP methyl ester carboxylesterase